MDELLFYVMPFLKNFLLLCLTVFFILFALAIKKVGASSFVLKVWLSDNMQRFITGGTFIFLLSIMMAATDTAPLFAWIGLDVNASPFALGMGICVLLGFISTKNGDETQQSVKAKAIIEKSTEITQQAAQIVRDEKKDKEE